VLFVVSVGAGHVHDFVQESHKRLSDLQVVGGRLSGTRRSVSNQLSERCSGIDGDVLQV